MRTQEKKCWWIFMLMFCSLHETLGNSRKQCLKSMSIYRTANCRVSTDDGSTEVNCDRKHLSKDECDRFVLPCIEFYEISRDSLSESPCWETNDFVCCYIIGDCDTTAAPITTKDVPIETALAPDATIQGPSVTKLAPGVPTLAQNSTTPVSGLITPAPGETILTEVSTTPNSRETTSLDDASPEPSSSYPKGPSNLCPTQNVDFGGKVFLLNETKTNHSIQFPCSNGISNFSWTCNHHSVWNEQPNLENCVRMESYFDKQEAGSKSKTAADNITSLYSKIKYQRLFNEERLVIYEGLKTLLDQLEQELQVTDEEAEETTGELGKNSEEQSKIVKSNQSKSFYIELVKIYEKISKEESEELREEQQLHQDVEPYVIRSNITSKLKEMILKTALLVSQTMVTDKSSSNGTFVKCMGRFSNVSIDEACNRCTTLEYKNAVDQDIQLIAKPLLERCGKCLGQETRLVHLHVTLAGDIFNFSCPYHRPSTIGRWNCQPNGIWAKHPDLSLCRSNFSIFEDAGSTNKTMSVAENMTDVLTRVANDNISLSGGDIITLMEGFDQLQNQYYLQSINSSLNENLDHLEKSFEIVNLMFDSANVFEELNEASSQLLTDIQSNIEKAASIVVKSMQLNTKKTLNYKQVEITLIRGNKDFIKQDNILTINFGTGYIKLPFINTTIDGKDNITIDCYIYNTLHCIKNPISCDAKENLPMSEIYGENVVNAKVMGATINGRKWTGGPDLFVTFKFSHIYDGNIFDLGQTKCVWWDESTNRYLNEGCFQEKSTQSYTVCRCNHLTNMAIITDVYGALDLSQEDLTVKESREIQRQNSILEWLSIVGSGCSVILLGVAIFCLGLTLKQRRSTRGHISSKKQDLIRLNININLMLFLIIFLVGLKRNGQSDVLCSLTASVLHYLLLVVFTWTFILAFTMHQCILRSQNAVQIGMKFLILAGYGVPFVFVAITLACFGRSSYGTQNWCWLAPNGSMWSLMGTITVITMMNLVVYVRILVYMIWYHPKNQFGDGRRTRGTNITSKESSIRKALYGSISLSLQLGMTWILAAFFMLPVSNFGLRVIFVVTNSLQGTGLFIFQILLNDMYMKELSRIVSLRMRKWFPILQRNADKSE